MPDQTLRDYYDRRRKAMKQEHVSFLDHYRELADFIRPRRGRFLVSDRNKGDRRWSNIINSRGTQALGVATAGLFNGIMSPTRPWMQIGTEDVGINEFGPHRDWLWLLQQKLYRRFTMSNLYTMSPVMIGELLLFGTGCMSDVDDNRDGARFYAHTVGSYQIAQDDRLEVNAVSREYEMTAEQIIGQFSRSPRDINPDISIQVRTAYDRGNYDVWFPVVQVVDANPLIGVRRRPFRGMPFRSVYYEPGNNIKEAFLSMKGFRQFPFYVPRWDMTGEDIYGTDCPGMVALGDVRGLQLEEKRKAQGIDKMVNPPLHGPPSLRNVPINSLPGGSTIYDAQGTQGLRAVYDVQLRINELVQDMDRVEARINEAFFVELFQAITNMEGVQPRNQLELTQRNQERLLRLGPMLERFHGEFLNMLVDRNIERIFEAGEMPPAPPDLQGRPLVPRYVSTLAMAQQATTTGNIDRLLGYIGGLAQVGYPRSIDKFDADQSVDEYAALIGAPPQLIKSDKAVAEKRKIEDQQAQQAQQMAMASEGADAAAKLGSVKADSIAGKVMEKQGAIDE
jgi:hypothetical protein